VDDHADIREPLETYLVRQGLDVRAAADAGQMRHLMRHERFDLVVLDVMLPDADGMVLCGQVMQSTGTPVILLTARSAPIDRVTGLEAGADDYMVKPFEPSELVARIRSVLRRQQRAAGGTGTTPRRYGFDGWIFDPTRRELTAPHGGPVDLSENECRLLAVLLAHPQTVLTRDRLLDLTRGADALVFDRSIDTQVSRLRRKLEPDPRRPTLIKTAWGNGYFFAADVRPLMA